MRLRLLVSLSIAVGFTTALTCLAAETQSIGYASVSEALADLRANADVSIREEEGWTIAEDHRDGFTLWSFTPPGHPANPAAVKRAILEKGGAFYIRMNVLCQADKVACDQLVDDFNQLNEQMRASIEASHASRDRRTQP